MPVDDIIQEVNTQARRQATDTRRRSPSDTSASRQSETAVHSPSAHYDITMSRLNVDQQTVDEFSTWFGIVGGLIRLL